MALVHATVATGTNDAGKQVSVNAWNAAHSISESLNFPDNSASPATSPSSGLDLFVHNLFQHWRLLGSENQNARVEYFNPHFLRTNVYKLVVGGGTTGATFATPVGFAITATANSFSMQTPAAGSEVTLSTRYTCASSAASSNVVDIRPTSLLACRASGFSFCTTFGMRANVTNTSAFFGLMDTTNAVSAGNWTTATTQSKIGIGFNGTTGNLKVIWGASGVTPTTTDLGANFPVNTTSFYRFCLFCLASDTTNLYWKVENLTTGNSATGTISAGMPAATVFMTPHQTVNNGATAASTSFDSTGFYLQTDTV